MKASGAWEAGDQSDQLYKEEKEEESLILYSFSSSVVGFFTPELTRAMFGPQETILGKNAHTVWETAYGQLALQMPTEAFDTWLRGIVLLHHAGGVFTFDARNKYAQAWLQDRLSKVIVRTLSQVAGCAVAVKFVLASEYVSSQENNHHD
jgi:hypothetical protein